MTRAGKRPRRRPSWERELNEAFGEPLPDETVAAKIDEIRVRNLATFKFDLLRTVSADPICTSADVEIMLAYLRFIDSIDAKAYCSNSVIGAETGLSQPVISKRRAALMKAGYLIPVGRNSRGIAHCRVANPRQSIVLDHILVATEHLKEAGAQRKLDERNRRPRVKESSTQNGRGVKETSTRGYKDLLPTTYSKYLEVFCSEEEHSLSQVSAANLDTNSPYPVPETESELVDCLKALFEGCELTPGTIVYFHRKLLAGELTPEMVQQHRRLVA